MTGKVLTIKKMDVSSITKCGIDKNGQPYYPCVIIDGHTLRMDKGILTHVNEPLTKWVSALGVTIRDSLVATA
jgi:hypothetical protein